MASMQGTAVLNAGLVGYLSTDYSVSPEEPSTMSITIVDTQAPLNLAIDS